MTTLTKFIPAISVTEPNVNRLSPVSGSSPTVATARPMTSATAPLTTARPDKLMVNASDITISAKYSGGPNDSATLASNGAKNVRPDEAEGPGHERRDCSNPQRRPGSPLLRHLVAVDCRRHRRCLAGNVDDDGGRRPAVHGAVVDGRHHDDRRRRRQHRAERQQDRDSRCRTDAWQHADERPHEAAHERIEHVRRRQRLCEALEKKIERNGHESAFERTRRERQSQTDHEDEVEDRRG